MTKKVLVFVISTAVVAVTGFLLGTRFMGLASQQAGHKPYTALLLETQYDGEGRQTHSEYHIYAVRGDGSHVRVMRRRDPRGQWVEVKSVVDLGAGKRVAVDPVTESVTTYPLSERTASEYGALASPCTSDPVPERTTILGYEAVLVVKQVPTSSNKVAETEKWVAPALNCLPLLDSFSVRIAGRMAAQVKREVVFVVEGEPPSSLFATPTEYTERAPSAVFDERARRFPGQPGGDPSSLQRLDESYRRHREKK